MAMNRQRRTSNISNIFSYDDAGNIVIKDYSQVIRYSWNGTIHGFIGPVSVSSVAAAVTDTDKFLVSDGGVLKFRTGAEVLSDIGGQPVLTNPVTGTGVVGQVAYWSGTNSQTGSNNLFWDAANARLGIGTNAPTEKLQIVGGFTASANSYISAGNLSIFTTNTPRRLNLQVANGSKAAAIGIEAGGVIHSVIGVDTSGNDFLQVASKSGISFYSGSTIGNIVTDPTNEKMRLTAAGRLLLGSTTEGTQLLQVYGDAFIKGSGATSATTALTIQNSSSQTLLSVKNNGQTTLTGTTNNDTTNIFRIEQQNGNGRFLVSASGQTQIVGDAFQSSESFVRIERNAFNPTSGGASHTSLLIQSTINQTGGANGITRGLYIQPTLTAAADWRSIEWSNNSGWGLYGAGTANNYLAGSLGIGTNAPSALLDIRGKARMETTSNCEFDFVGGGGNILRIASSATTPFIGTLTGAPLGFFTAAAERGRFSTNGNLLVGTTTDAGYRLDVNGTARVSGDVSIGASSATTVISTYNSTTRNRITYTNNSSFEFFEGANERMRLAGGSGNLGIGTTSPVGKLTSADSVNNGTANVLYLSNTSQTGVTSAAINFINIDGTIKSSIIGAVFGNDYMTFNVGSNTERMRISSAGNLLLGTTTDTGYRCQITSPSADTHLNVWGTTAPSIRLDNAASGATQRFVIGLATATNNFIQGANAGDVCMTPGTSSALVFGMWQTSSSSEVMRISTSSNVLIGKNTDSGQKLQVVGKVNLTSLPTSATGLVAGDIWNNGGVLNIV